MILVLSKIISKTTFLNVSSKPDLLFPQARTTVYRTTSM